MPEVRAPLHFPAVQTHLLPSQHVGQTFRIDVVQPLQSRHEQRFPVIYATDGNAIVDLFKGLARLLQAYRPETPAFTLVTIGYPSDSPVAGEILRARDLTFPGCADWISGFELPWEDVLKPDPGAKTFGGGEAFQRFMAEELMPFVEARYAVQQDARTYFGHSVGGAFGLYTLFSRSNLFNNYIVSSPALSYHGTSAAGVHHDCDFMLSRAQDFIAQGKSLEGVRLYMSVGTREETEAMIANWRFTSSFRRMTTFLEAAKIPGLALKSETFEGEGHATSWPIAFMHGVPWALGDV